jgi:hypothetical protein
MPKLNKKQQYRHKSGSEKLKLKLNKELKTEAEDKGQTKINFGTFPNRDTNSLPLPVPPLRDTVEDCSAIGLPMMHHQRLLVAWTPSASANWSPTPNQIRIYLNAMCLLFSRITI